jgi:hypothetical protein
MGISRARTTDPAIRAAMTSGLCHTRLDAIGLFDTLPGEIELDVVRVVDTPEATHLRYRVRR